MLSFSTVGLAVGTSRAEQNRSVVPAREGHSTRGVVESDGLGDDVRPAADRAEVLASCREALEVDRSLADGGAANGVEVGRVALRRSLTAGHVRGEEVLHAALDCLLGGRIDLGHGGRGSTGAEWRACGCCAAAAVVAVDCCGGGRHRGVDGGSRRPGLVAVATT